MSTSFFNDRNRNIARELSELIVESNVSFAARANCETWRFLQQELPEWLDKVGNESRSGGPRGNIRRGGGGGQRFGGRDHRIQPSGGGGMPTNGAPMGGMNRGGGFGNNFYGAAPAGGQSGFSSARNGSGAPSSNRAVRRRELRHFHLQYYSACRTGGIEPICAAPRSAVAVRLMPIESA